MPALNKDFEIIQGGTFKRIFTVMSVNPDFPNDRTKDTPFDFTNFALRGTVRDNFGKELTTFTLTAESNKVSATLSAVKTAALKAGITFSCKYDVEAESPDGDVYPIANGRFKVKSEQSK